jgi:hypothetical protein
MEKLMDRHAAGYLPDDDGRAQAPGCEVKSPIVWNSFVFLHTSSDDMDDRYTGDGVSGRLVHQRGTGIWLAYLREACGRASPTKHQALEDTKDVARAALNGAVEVLRRRVAGDEAWLAALDKELG